MRGKSALALAFLSLSLFAQQPGQSPRFKGGGTSVVVDVVVTDKANRVVKELKPEDFVIYEDDVPQTISTFRLVHSDASVRASTPGQSARPQEPAPELGQAAPIAEPVRPNLIVILLDFATTDFENQKLVQEASVKYVRENLRRNDYVAVFSLAAAFRFLQDFTNDREALLAALQRRDISGRSMAAMGGNEPSLSSSDSMMLADQGATTIALSNAATMQAAGQAAQAGGSQAAMLMSAERIQALFYRMSSYVAEREARSVLRAIAAIARGVESIEGRKTLIMFSQGFVVGGVMERDLQKTVSIANRANLAVYAIDSQGLMPKAVSGDLIPSGELSSISAATGPRRKYATGGESLFDRAQQVGSDLRDTALRYVTGATGGFTIRNTNDLHLGMQRIDADLRSYYLLTYQPTNQDFDGRFRNIRVEVKREGLSVRGRNGYRAVPAGMETVNDEEFQLLRAAESRQVPFDLKAYLRLDSFLVQKPEQNVLVTIEIPTSAVRFEQAKEKGKETDTLKQLSKLDVVGLIRDGDGKVVERFGTPINLHLTPTEYEVLSKGSISFSNRFEVVPGMYSVEVLVKDELSSRVGLMEASIQVPAWSPDLTLSTIVLGKDVERSTPGSEFLTADGTRVLPVARRVFRNGDKLVFYFDIYNFKLEPGNSPKLSVTVSLQRSGETRQITLPEYVIADPQKNGWLSFARYLELKGLRPGTYFLTANVADRVAGKTVETRTTFTVEN